MLYVCTYSLVSLTKGTHIIKSFPSIVKLVSGISSITSTGLPLGEFPLYRNFICVILNFSISEISVNNLANWFANSGLGVLSSYQLNETCKFWIKLSYCDLLKRILVEKAISLLLS
ncbi:hypothetical protein NWQ34_06505 [Mycoplasmopsis felis]|uniref:hypothetical protein n=1 Tax=Mycoplasmopsis felis TaxID=33923 RepID=UPI0021E03D90|nr:hypothetical protein [Mycoplasmopsis felis]MCU9939188.1 hypothetical protein [Mycoplasmopsis felis]